MKKNKEIKGFSGDPKTAVQAVLHEVAESFRPDLVEYKTSRMNSLLTTAREQNGFTAVSVNYNRQGGSAEYKQFTESFASIITPYEISRFANNLKDRHGNNLVFFIVNLDAAPALIDKAANKFADAVVADFKRKVTEKMFDIVQSKISLLSNISGGGMISRNSFRFDFSDGSGFTTLAQIVHACNAHGTFYQRYPLTFHNVTVSGTKMKTPSEAKVKEAFAGIAAEKKGPTVHAIGEYWSKFIGKKVGLCVGSGVGAQRFYGITTENPNEVTCLKCKKNLE
jgi:hypothetical protein